MSINLLQLAQTTLGGQVVQLASTHFGIDASKAKAVFETLTPSLIASLLKKADTPDGARALYASIMSHKVDANIGANLVSLLDNPVSAGNLIKAGGEQAVALLGDKAQDQLTNVVAQHTGTAVGAVTAMTGVVTATLFGLIKNHLQTSKGQQHTLISTLAHQVSFIQGKVPESVGAALGAGTAWEFFDGIGNKLKAALSAFHVESPPAAHTGFNPVSKEKTGIGKWWWLLALLALAALLFFLRSCNKEPASASTPATASEASTASAVLSKEPTLSLTTDKDGKAAVVATVGSEMDKSAILEDLKKNYGDAVNADIKVDAATKPAGWIGELPDLLTSLKLSNAELTIKGNNIEIGGAATDPKLQLLDKTKALFGAGYAVSLFDLSEAMASSKKKFEDALAALKPGSCTTADVVSAMNTYSFNFSSGAFDIPKEDVLEFGRAATAIKDCAKDAKLEIGGHTDNQGTSAVNMELSQKRADAVRDFFVSKGIAAATFTTKAYGDSQPIGDNDIASGRFKNRRIEFSEQK
ncbi:OmpA family protein [Collimonas humicola]|uniref:OmpA family protein n=1 Tax=Collimonas humicola TaxID=2825886 RepID=UPI001B8CCCD0|nr:OmpA family protein [Collimonas humicola]